MLLPELQAKQGLALLYSFQSRSFCIALSRRFSIFHDRKKTGRKSIALEYSCLLILKPILSIS